MGFGGWGLAREKEDDVDVDGDGGGLLMSPAERLRAKPKRVSERRPR